MPLEMNPKVSGFMNNIVLYRSDELFIFSEITDLCQMVCRITSRKLNGDLFRAAGDVLRTQKSAEHAESRLLLLFPTDVGINMKFNTYIEQLCCKHQEKMWMYEQSDHFEEN